MTKAQDVQDMWEAGQWFGLLAATEEGEAVAGGMSPARLLHLQALARVNLGAVEEAKRVLNAGWTKATAEATEDPALLSDLWGVRARIAKEMWRRDGQEADLKIALDAYRGGYDLTGAAYPAINAAMLARVAGMPHRALARAALTRARAASATDPLDYWSKATVAEALLLLDDIEGAQTTFANAVPMAAPAQFLSTRRQIHLLQEVGISIPGGIVALFEFPSVLAFSGHRIDVPGSPPRFPPEREEAVAARIADALDAQGVRIAYGSAASGADILFLEALQARGAETNIVLPFDEGDFLEVSVGPPGSLWRRRYDAVTAAATSRRFVTDQPYLGESVLFEACNAQILGSAARHAVSLEVPLTVLAAHAGDDHTALTGRGGTTDFLHRARGLTRHIEVLETLHNAPTGACRRAPIRLGQDPGLEDNERRMVAMLFSDLRGFGTLGDADLPEFIAFQKIVADQCRASLNAMRSIRTIGDAILAVDDDVVAILDLASALRSAVAEANDRQNELPISLDIRIALHAAPIYAVQDPFTGREDWFGKQIVRAARLEPVTLPGHIFATEEFVASLFASGTPREHWRDRIFPELVGNLELAKGFGKHPIYNMVERGA